MNPDPRLLPPDDAAWHVDMVDLDHQREVFGNADGGADLERGAGLGKVTHRAIDCSAAERHLASLQQPAPWCCSVLVHRMDLRDERVRIRHGRYYPVTANSGCYTTKGDG